MLNHNAKDPQILLFEDAELKTTYNMEDLTRQIFLKKTVQNRHSAFTRLPLSRQEDGDGEEEKEVTIHFHFHHNPYEHFHFRPDPHDHGGWPGSGKRNQRPCLIQWRFPRHLGKLDRPYHRTTAHGEQNKSPHPITIITRHNSFHGLTTKALNRENRLEC